jgi:hypothetical protein
MRLVDLESEQDEPRQGPRKGMTELIVSGREISDGARMSFNMPGLLARTELPKKPMKNRQTRT